MADLLRSSIQAGKVRHGQWVLGKPVCPTAFQRLLGIGSGRFFRLKHSVSKGEPPAVDGRFVSQKHARRKGKKHMARRALVHEFLEEIRHTLAEPMPETASYKRPTGSASASAKAEAEAGPSDAAQLGFRRLRGRRPRLVSKEARKHDKSSMRLLPPGTFSDYLALFHEKHTSDGVKVSLKLFISVPALAPAMFARTYHAWTCFPPGSFSIIPFASPAPQLSQANSVNAAVFVSSAGC